MNPNINLTEIARDEYEVRLSSRYLGVVWLTERGTWTAEVARGEDDGHGFDTLGDAVDWLVE
jgi:hypothetical protein